MVQQRRRPSGFIEPGKLSKVARPRFHEIKPDGYRLMVRRDGARVRSDHLSTPLRALLKAFLSVSMCDRGAGSGTFRTWRDA
jgi:hypothetical protein